MFTIMTKGGYAMMNGAGQALVFATEDDAEAYIAGRAGVASIRPFVTITPVDFRSA